MSRGPYLIYVEQALDEHPRVRALLQRFPDVPRVHCQHYGEVFNRRAQSFRLQKQAPALILARKQGRRILPAPAGYGIGARHNYYFSHLLNCPYDCRYCFLQGKYRSAHHVLFVNYEEFARDITALCRRHAGEPVHFFSGYDGDSLALDPLSGFVGYFLALFRQLDNGVLELRSKSTQVRSLLCEPAAPGVVAAWSFTPRRIARALEHRAAPVARRIAAMEKLQARGWSLGIRIDPLIHTAGYRAQYQELFADLFRVLRPGSIHSVTVGSFRLPRAYFRALQKLYPEEPLFALPTSERDGVLGFRQEVEQEMLSWCLAQLADFVPADKIFSCQPVS